jgi:hypothetical protein
LHLLRTFCAPHKSANEHQFWQVVSSSAKRVGPVAVRSNLAWLLSTDIIRECQRCFVSTDTAFSSSAVRAPEAHHIHVEQAERYAKFWLTPISLAESRGFRSSELRELHNLEQHRESFILAWDEHFGQ